MLLKNKNIFLLLLGTNLLALMIISHNYYNAKGPNRITTTIDIPETSTLKFKDPETAYYILQKLDIFEVYEDPSMTPEEAKIQYNKAYLGLTTDDNYCEKHRAHFVNHPEMVFEEKNFITNYKARAVLRYEVIPRLGGRDIMPYVHSRMSDAIEHELVYDLRNDLNMYFTTTSMCEYRQVGKHFSCLTQESNHIPGHDHLYRKDYVGRSLVEYGKYYHDRPQCFNDQKFFPKTWILTEEDQCREFFEIFNSEEYLKMKEERGLVYIRKIGANAHQGHGVFPVNDKEEVYIRNKYKDGKLCGYIDENNLMQYAIWNPLLLNGRKFDFRMFMMIASTNPLILYYRDGFLRVSLRDYNPNSEEKGAILTNIALSKPFFELAKENGTYNGYTEDDLMNQAFWTMPKLEKFLIDNNVTNDTNWLENYLRPEFKKAYIHLLRMSSGPFARRSSLYEVYGLDFMLDENLNLWFIEANAEPLLDGWSDDTKVFFNSILYDSFDIAMGLLRSRTKRIVNYVNKLMDDVQVWKIGNDDVYIQDLANKRTEFRELSKNYFEPEYLPKPGNKYSLIIDENIEGPGKYFGYINEECF